MENQQVIRFGINNQGLADVGANDNDQRLIVSFGANKRTFSTVDGAENA